MDADEHAAGAVGLAVALVNRLTAGHARGTEQPAPVPERRPAALAEVLRGRPNRARAWQGAGAEELVAASALADRLREVFEAAEDADTERAAQLVNALLAHGDVRPVLSDHHDEPWHLHAHWPDAAPAAALRATCGLGLARLLADGGAARLGVCAATSCDRVHGDTSRNGTGRFCSFTCRGRTETAASRGGGDA